MASAVVEPDLPRLYAEAAPFPHLVIDHAFERVRIDRVAAEVANTGGDDLATFYGQRRKVAVSDPTRMGSETAALIDEMNGPAFISWLEHVTGITGLQADPGLFGGGIHRSSRGGFLKVHADFNWHEPLRLYRRVNVLLYLNRRWRPEWNGDLELWSTDMSACAASIAPLLNRMVIFSTNDDSFHGHPDPLACPEEVTRDSIALYYYSRAPAGRVDKLTLTDYRERPREQFTGAKHRVHQAMIRHPLMRTLVTRVRGHQ